MLAGPSIRIGPLTIHLYGLIIALAIYAGYYLAKRRTSLYRIPKKIFDDPLLLMPLALAIVVARIYHVLDYWSLYSRNPIEILYIANGGLGIWGAIAGTVLGFWVVAKVRKIDFFSALDLASPSLLLGQAIGRLGNWVNQEGYGPPSSAPWSVYIDEAHRPLQYQNFSHFHPTFFYEAALDLIFFAVLIFAAKRLMIKGQVFGLYLIFYSLIRFTTEYFRIDTWVLNGFKVAHVISVFTFAVGLYLIAKGRFISQAD